MYPTIHDGDRVIYNPWASDFDIDDVVFSQGYLLKRVKGVPGDTVTNSLTGEDITLGEGEYWLEGDNIPSYSRDSRQWGPFQVRGRVEGLYCPHEGQEKPLDQKIAFGFPRWHRSFFKEDT